MISSCIRQFDEVKGARDMVGQEVSRAVGNDMPAIVRRADIEPFLTEAKTGLVPKFGMHDTPAGRTDCRVRSAIFTELPNAIFPYGRISDAECLFSKEEAVGISS